MKKTNSFASSKHDLAGYAALDFLPKQDFSFFAEKFAGCDPQRFQPVALRFFIKGGKPVVTLYAVDKLKKENKESKNKLAVRKFKLSLSLNDFMEKIKQFDFTVTAQGVDIETLLVTQK